MILRWLPLLFLFISPFLSSSSPPPNIVLIMADDLGWADISPNNPSIKYTPNLQKLSESGTRYTDYHSAAPICTPSRAGLLTGRLAQRTGVIDNFHINSVAGLPLTEHTLGDYMQSAGYRTGMIGKWHLGITPDYHPLSRGFDYWFGLPYSVDMGCIECVAYDNYNHLCGGKRSNESVDTVSLPLFQDRNIIEAPVDLTKLTSRYISAAQDFMSSALSAESPFFLYVPLSHVHTPLATGPQFANASKAGHYGDTVMEMDGFVGQIVDWLDAKDAEKSTLVIFTSDNGPWEVKCELGGEATPFLGLWQKTVGKGGSCSKGTTWEGGHRVPLIVSWPGTLPAGQVSGDLVSALDIVPTFADIAGFKLPDDRVFDGIPFPFVKPHNGSRTLMLPNSGPVRDYTEIWAMRLGKYKVYYGTEPKPDCSNKHGTGVQYHNPALVFDLEMDPRESSPLKNVPPALYTRAEEEMKRFRDSVGSTFRSVADYTMDSDTYPCCNKDNDYCAC